MAATTRAARSRDGVTEKDLVAQLVARVRLALLSTRKYRIVLTRTGDANVTFEQRAVAANVAGAAYFLTFHAGDLGGSSPRIAVYTYQPPGPPLPSPGGEARSIFVPWNQVQEAYLDQSRQLAQALAATVRSNCRGNSGYAHGGPGPHAAQRERARRGDRDRQLDSR